MIFGKSEKKRLPLRAALVVGGLAMLGYVLINNQMKEGQLLGSAKGDPYGITKFIADTKEEVAYFDRINMMCSIYPENYVTKDGEKRSGKKAEVKGQSNEPKEEDE